MNFTESFQEFSSKVGATDLALYAGVGLVLWILFKDKLSPVQKVLSVLADNIKNLLNTNQHKNTPVVPVKSNVISVDTDDLFFKLVASWKQTRDLAVASGCVDAVQVADQMFPYLSPTVCVKKDVV